jgi:ATP-dependent RNA helicase RhlB
VVRSFLRKIRQNLLSRLTPSAPPEAPAAAAAPRPPEALARKPPHRRPTHHVETAKPASTPAAAPATAAAPSSPVPRPSSPPWSRDQYVVAPAEGKTRFHDLAVSDEILHAVSDLGFQYCTPIQARAIPPALEGQDVFGRAQTGTGKTAAFLITIFTRFLRQKAAGGRPRGYPRALILAPTRELVVQIEHDAEELGKYCPFRVMAVYGGMDYEKQKRQIKGQPPDVLVATPGRLLDFRQSAHVDLRHVEVLVIDEADRMLDMGFIPDVRTIVHATPPKDRRQTMLWSATLTEDVVRLASRWTREPVRVEVEPEQVAVKTVDQVTYTVSSKDKFALLYNLLDREGMTRVLVFCNRRDQTRDLADALRRRGVSCDMLSGDVPQPRRLKILDDFRSGKLRVVVATDVAGRGIHVDDISHVVNYEIPYEAEDYVHRIGRTGRAGATGTAFMFACENESFSLPAIEQYLGHPLEYVNPEPDLLRPPPHATVRAEPLPRPPPPRGGGRRGGPPRRGGPRPPPRGR